MKTRKVKGHLLTTAHIIIGVHHDRLGLATFAKPLKVWELIGKVETSGFRESKSQTYHVGPMDGDTSKQFLARVQFTGYSDVEYQVIETY